MGMYRPPPNSEENFEVALFFILELAGFWTFSKSDWWSPK